MTNATFSDYRAAYAGVPRSSPIAWPPDVVSSGNGMDFLAYDLHDAGASQAETVRVLRAAAASRGILDKVHVLAVRSPGSLFPVGATHGMILDMIERLMRG